MNAPVRLRMTPEEFEPWETRQAVKHELVGGEVRAMAGAQVRHNMVSRNVLVALANGLRGRPCQPFGSDLRVAIPNGNYRYPDITVDCGKPRPDAMYADKPTVMIEVLSEANDWFDVRSRLADYQSIPTVRHIAIFSTEELRADLWTRGSDGWTNAEAFDVEGVVDFAALDIRLALSEAYEGAFDE
ncbi:MAG: Uma2 family endonuclease [Hyphomonadaceae bacterium]|nr:Uma2 family endonuclease [Hyphomonadaceae bacterium]